MEGGGNVERKIDPDSAPAPADSEARQLLSAAFQQQQQQLLQRCRDGVAAEAGASGTSSAATQFQGPLGRPQRTCVVATVASAAALATPESRPTNGPTAVGGMAAWPAQGKRLPEQPV